MGSFWVLLLIPVALLAFWIMTRQKVQGKVLCFIIEADSSVTVGLYPRSGDFVIVGEEAYYLVNPRATDASERTLTRIINYPMGMPAFMQVPVSAALLRRGDAQALDWTNLPKRVVSSVEVGAVLEPKWLANIVKGIVMAPAGGWQQRLLPIITIALSGITLLMLWFVMGKVNAIEEAIKLLR
jgi:hypothetical protein